MTWELGGGYGHLGRLASLAAPLKAAGHEVVFAVRDTKIAEKLLSGTGIPVRQAPALTMEQQVEMASFGQILMHNCFNEAVQAKARTRGWRDLYAEIQPDLIVADHSPTSLLAARGLGIRCITVGTGFLIPPDLTPLPNLRTWENIAPAKLAQDETQALAVMNQVLESLGQPPLARVSQLYDFCSKVFFTLRELDFYAAVRPPGTEYLGPAFLNTGKAPVWPAGSGKRVFVYLRPFKTLPSLLESLRATACPTLVHIANVNPEFRARFDGSNVAFSEEPLDMLQVARECDLAIHLGGHGVLAPVLLAGKPQLLMPAHLEMMVHSLAATQLGAALIALERKPLGMQHKLKRLLEEPAFSEAARRFAERYADLKVEKIPERFARQVERILAH